MYVCTNGYVWTFNACACEINEYLRNYAYMEIHIHDSVIICNEIMKAIPKSHKNMPETVSISFNGKNVVYKNDYYILHITFFITNHIVFKKFYYLLLFYKLLVKTKRHFHINDIKLGRNNDKTIIKIMKCPSFNISFFIIHYSSPL